MSKISSGDMYIHSKDDTLIVTIEDVHEDVVTYFTLNEEGIKSQSAMFINTFIEVYKPIKHNTPLLNLLRRHKLKKNFKKYYNELYR